MKNLFSICSKIFVLSAIVSVVGCSHREAAEPTPSALNGVWVVNEGNFGVSNAKITAYDPTTNTTIEDIFGKANSDAALGDSPTQIVLHNDQVFISLSNSGKAYILNPQTAAVEGKITDLHSPRYFAFVSSDKGYISNLNEPSITIFNPSTSAITGKITLESAAEQMVVRGDYVYANQWSYGQQIIKIDTKTDKVVDSVKVGIQPNCILADRNGNFWTLCDGGWQGNPLGYEQAKIVRIVNLGDKMVVANQIDIPDGDTFNYRMAMSPAGDRIYFIVANKLYAMDIDQTTPPTEPMITVLGATFYSLAVNPHNGDIYLGDAVDYTQSGTVYRFDRDGKQVDKFSSGGVSPSSYLF